MKKAKNTKLGKSLIKGLKEAKESKTNLLYDGKWHKDGKEFNTFDEYIEYCHKQEKEKMKKLTPEQRKKIKDKEKAQIAKRKVQDKKNEEKWAKQRAKRNFSDSDCWSLDYFYLELFNKTIEHLIKNMHGWQPYLGYKIEKGKLIKLKKVKTKDKYTGKTVSRYPEITYKEYKEVLKYLAKGFRQLYSYLNMEDLDYKKNYTHKDYVERDKKIWNLHCEIFNLFRDCFYSLWD